MREAFRKIAHTTAELVGTAWAFIIAFLLVVGWAASGPFFEFSNTWQLVINTSTTILTFLMVFLIQNSQNRDAKATHLKLDELIHSIKRARDSMVNIEELSDEELDRLYQDFEKIKKHADERREKRKKIHDITKELV